MQNNLAKDMMFKFPADLRYVKEASKKVLRLLDDLQLDESTLFDIKLCFEEAFINAVKYGTQQKSSSRDEMIEVDISIKSDAIEMSVYDNGSGFDIESCDDPTKEENLAKTRGRGVFLIKKFMDKTGYDIDKRCLYMTKKISPVT